MEYFIQLHDQKELLTTGVFRLRLFAFAGPWECGHRLGLKSWNTLGTFWFPEKKGISYFSHVLERLLVGLHCRRDITRHVTLLVATFDMKGRLRCFCLLEVVEWEAVFALRCERCLEAPSQSILLPCHFKYLVVRERRSERRYWLHFQLGRTRHGRPSYVTTLLFSWVFWKQFLSASSTSEHQSQLEEKQGSFCFPVLVPWSVGSKS